MARDLMTGALMPGLDARARRRGGGQAGRLLLLVAGCLSAGFGRSGLAQAQRLNAPPPASAHEMAGHDTAGPDPASRAGGTELATPYPGISEAPADTGRMRHGWHDFSRYDWAGPLKMCGEAVQGALARVWRHAEGDTASYATRALAVQPVAVGLVAQRCGGGQLPAYLRQLAAGDTATLRQGLFPAYNIALALGPEHDADATALIRGVLTHTPASEYNHLWWTLLDAFRADTTTRPLRLNLFERDTALFDSLARIRNNAGAWAGPWSELGRLARTALWKHWLYLQDTARARVALEAALSADRRFNTELNLKDPAWRALLRLAILQHGVRSRAVVDFIKQGVAQAKGDTSGTALLPYPLFDLMQYGQPFVWPRTPYWYSATGTPLSVTRDSAGQPIGLPPLPAGKVTLIWNPHFGNDHTITGIGATPNLLVVQWLRKLVARYGPDGLQVVILEHTRGSAIGASLLEPEEEAGAIRHYYQDMLQLPAAVVVEPVAFKTLPDGRRMDEVTDWERRYHPFLKGLGIKYRNPAQPFALASPEGPFLLDRHGKLRLMSFLDLDLSLILFSGDGDATVELFIQQLLKES